MLGNFYDPAWLWHYSSGQSGHKAILVPREGGIHCMTPWMCKYHIVRVLCGTGKACTSYLWKNATCHDKAAYTGGNGLEKVWKSILSVIFLPKGVWCPTCTLKWLLWVPGENKKKQVILWDIYLEEKKIIPPGWQIDYEIRVKKMRHSLQVQNLRGCQKTKQNKNQKSVIKINNT